jgi:hypothetical protein
MKMQTMTLNQTIIEKTNKLEIVTPNYHKEKINPLRIKVNKQI